MDYCLVCDDHALMRTALAGAVALIWPEARIDTARDFAEAKLLAGQGPGLILCDLVMPGDHPVRGIEAIKRAAPQAKLVVITGTEDDALLLGLLGLGIDGFIPKSAGAEVVEAGLRLVAAGGRYLPPRVAELAIGGGAAAAAAVRLTDRQRDVLEHMARGKSNKEIARELDLSPATVKVHAAAIIALLGAANRTEAVFQARQANLI